MDFVTGTVSQWAKLREDEAMSNGPWTEECAHERDALGIAGRS